MGQDNYNIKNRKGKHLNYEERIKIETLRKENMKASEIAIRIGCSKRTIERELKRGTVELMNSDLTMRTEYSADLGQNIYDEKGTAKGPNLKIGNNHKLVEAIEKRIQNKYSPYAALEDIKNNTNEETDEKIEVNICLKTLYNYIDMNLFLNITNKDLPVKKNKKKRNYRKIRTAITNKKGTSIVERPEEVDLREDYGHWEMDTVVGKKGTKACLLVLTERTTRQELIYKMTNKSQECVVKALDTIERKIGRVKFSNIFKTITTDNGCEFLDFEGIEKSITSKTKTRTKQYFAHPFSSWERGSNETANKLIRRFIPKGEEFTNISKKQIKQIMHWINNYPRKILDGKSSSQVFDEQFNLIA